MLAIDIHRNALDIACARDAHKDVFFLDEFRDVHFADGGFDLRAARVSEFLADFQEFFFDDGEEHGAILEDFSVTRNLFDEAFVLGGKFFVLESGESSKHHVEYGGRLHVGEFKAFHKRIFGDFVVLRFADDPDHFVDVLLADEESLDDVCAFLGAFEIEDRTSPNNLNLVIEIMSQKIVEREEFRLAADEGEVDDAESRLHLRVFVEEIEDDLRIGVTF